MVWTVPLIINISFPFPERPDPTKLSVDATIILWYSALAAQPVSCAAGTRGLVAVRP
jgi:hypothetical protein